jgi:hypothetical protein
MKTKDEAVAKAKKTLSMMKTPGWKMRVWDNSGWHFALQKGGMSIHWSEEHKTYSCLLSTSEGSSGGEVFWSDANTSGIHFESKDPNKAVNHQLAVAQRFVNNCQRVINKVKSKGRT